METVVETVVETTAETAVPATYAAASPARRIPLAGRPLALACGQQGHTPRAANRRPQHGRRHVALACPPRCSFFATPALPQTRCCRMSAVSAVTSPSASSASPPARGAVTSRRDRLTTLRLLAELHDESLGLVEAADLVSSDAELADRLMRVFVSHISASTSSVRREVRSLREATLLLGCDRLRNWATLLALWDLASEGRFDADEETTSRLHVTATRGRLCHILGERLFGAPRPAFSTVGYFSKLDTLFPDAKGLAAQLPLTHEVRQAMRQRGPLGPVLVAAIGCETGEFDDIPNAVTRPNESTESLEGRRVEAADWATRTHNALKLVAAAEAKRQRRSATAD